MFFGNIDIARPLTVLRVRYIRQGSPAKHSAVPHLLADMSLVSTSDPDGPPPGPAVSVLPSCHRRPPAIAWRANSQDRRKYLYRFDIDQALWCRQSDGLIA